MKSYFSFFSTSLTHSLPRSTLDLFKISTQLGNHYPEIDLHIRYPQLSLTDLKSFQAFSQILKDPFSVAEGLKFLNKKTSQSSLKNPELALEQTLSHFEKDYFDQKEVVDVTSELSVADFMKLVSRSANMRDKGVSYFHGSQTHRIQKIILALQLSPKMVDSTIAKMAIPNYLFINPNPTLGGKNSYTLWDDIMDRPAEICIPNKDKKPLNQLVFDDCFLMPHTLFPVCDSRSPEWLRFMISICEEIPFLQIAFAAEASKRSSEIHSDFFVSLLEIDFFHKKIHHNNLRSLPTYEIKHSF